MEEMSKNFKSIENSIARYIYKKYIMPNHIDVKDNISNKCMNNLKEDGIDGIDGIDGMNGMNGMDGMNGMNGIDGIDGIDGMNGMDGMNGIDGIDGMDGIKNTNKPQFDNKLYKIYLQKIFYCKRQSFRILQEDVLKEDLKQMAIADNAYDINPKQYNILAYDSFPDVLRCTYIRKYKHRYYRCKNKVINDDSDICKKHENSDNIYLDKYNELLK
jgi:hypothetical protein